MGSNCLIRHCVAAYYEIRQLLSGRLTVSKETITFRIEAEKREALDAIAALMDRDRSYVLNEAISAYLEINQWQLEHIKYGMRQADAGEFATEAEVKAAFDKWRR